MLRELRQQKIVLLVGLLFGLSSFMSLVSPFIPSANATSIYDNLVQPVSSVVAGGTTACPLERDFSIDWYSQILDDNNLYSGGQTARSNVRAAIAEALDEGTGIAVSQVNDSGDKYIGVFATVPSASSTIIFSNAYGYQHMDMTNVISLQIQMINSGGVCVPQLDYNDSQATRDIVFDYSGVYTRQPFFINNFVTYPTGYDGESVSSLNILPIAGNVQCANTNNIISTVHINAQSGIDGNAVITDDGIGGKNYRFFLSEESSYSLVVLCDGDTFYGPTVDVDLYDNYNWVCTPTGGLNVCATS